MRARVVGSGTRPVDAPNSIFAKPCGRAPMSLATPVNGLSVARRLSLSPVASWVFNVLYRTPLSGSVVRELIPSTEKAAMVTATVEFVPPVSGLMLSSVFKKRSPAYKLPPLNAIPR